MHTKFRYKKTITEHNVAEHEMKDHIWVVLEYMEGGNLYQILSAMEESKTGLTEGQAAYIICEVSSVLNCFFQIFALSKSLTSVADIEGIKLHSWNAPNPQRYQK